MEEFTFEELKEAYQKVVGYYHKLKGQVQTLKRNQTQLEAAIAERDAAIEERIEYIKQITQEKEALEQTIGELKATENAPSEELNEAITLLNEERRTCLEELSALQKRFEDAECQIQKKDGEIHRLNLLVASLRSAEDENEELHDRLKNFEKDQMNQNTEFMEKESRLTRRITQLETENSNLERRTATLEEKLREFQNEIDELSIENRRLTEENLSLNDHGTETETQLAQLAEENKKLLVQTSDYELQLQRLCKRRDTLETNKIKLEKRCQQLETEKSDLEEHIKAIEVDRKTTDTKSCSVFPSYIRKVLLQFFALEGTARDRLIPIILQLVECDENQIVQAQRMWTQNNQIISQAFQLIRKQ